MDVAFDVRMPNLDLEGGMTVLCGRGEEAGVLLIAEMKVQPAGVNPDLACLPARRRQSGMSADLAYRSQTACWTASSKPRLAVRLAPPRFF